MAYTVDVELDTVTFNGSTYTIPFNTTVKLGSDTKYNTVITITRTPDNIGDLQGMKTEIKDTFKIRWDQYLGNNVNNVTQNITAKLPVLESALENVVN